MNSDTAPSRMATSYSARLAIPVTALIGPLAVLPVILARFPPLNDYPFHMARVVILNNITDPILDRFYDVGSLLLPNLGMDAVTFVLAQFMAPETAARVFVALCILSLLLGAILLHRAIHGRLTVWPLLAIAVVYNGILSYGFLNYLFGLGLSLMAMATWLSMRQGTLRLVVAFAWSVVLVFCHMQAFGIFAIMAASVELYTAVVRWRQVRNWRPLFDLIYAGIPFFLVLGLFFALSPTAEAEAKRIAYDPWLGAKPYGLLYSLSVRVLWLDLFTLAVVLLVSAWLLLGRSLTVSRPFVVAFVFLALVAAFIPPNLMGAFMVDIRLAPALELLAFVALNTKHDAAPRYSRVVVLAVCVLVVVRTGALSAIWQQDEKQVEPVIEAFEKIEPGATLFAASAEPFPNRISSSAERRAAWRPSMKHVASYAVLAHPIFVPMTYANPTQQPMLIDSTYAPLKEYQGDPPISIRGQAEFQGLLEDLRRRMQSGTWPKLDGAYLFVVGSQELKPLVLPDYVELVDQNDRFLLLRFLTAGN